MVLHTEEYFAGEKAAADHSVVVLSHDCEIDKPNNSSVLVARVLPLNTRPAADQGHIQQGRVRNAMHVPAVGGLQESYIDFRFIQRVLKSELEDGMATGNRVASLTDDGRLALLANLWRFFTREAPPSPTETQEDRQDAEEA